MVRTRALTAPLGEAAAQLRSRPRARLPSLPTTQAAGDYPRLALRVVVLLRDDFQARERALSPH